MQRECIPLPGPPEENELAEPRRTRKMLNNYICSLFEWAPGNAIAH